MRVLFAVSALLLVACVAVAQEPKAAEEVAASPVRGSSIEDRAAKKLIEAGDASARSILERRRADLDEGVTLLIARETLTSEEFAPLRPVSVQQKAAE